MSNIRSLLNDIISDTDNSYKSIEEKVNNDTAETAMFDKNAFREKISMFVLKDIVSAMMHDETDNLDCMIDESIEKHITDNYSGSCYGYLANARDTLKSPIIGNIIQEINDKTQSISNQICAKKDVSIAENSVDTKEILDGVENYDDLRKKIKDQVSKKVIDDVTNVITTSNDAPVFDDIDEKLTKSDTEDVTSESVILRLAGSIVVEYAASHIKTRETMSTEEGINRAIVEYCIHEMDVLFKQSPKVSIFAKI